MIRVFKATYLTTRLFQAIGVILFLLLLGYFFSPAFLLGKVLFFVLLGVLGMDILLLFAENNGFRAQRFTPEKLSNGDENEIRIFLENRYSFAARVVIHDEIPHQFQRRDINFIESVPSRETRILQYQLRPVKRGEYSFGLINILVHTPLGLVARRYRFGEEKMVPVYPGYLQLRKYELMAISNDLIEMGVKKIRRVGHNMEFEQIKDYTLGDDIRTVNWKATARRGHLMVNHYQDEKSQMVWSVIDKSRTMQMPFRGMTLLDYAINASLVISNIAIRKDDRAGLITFQHRVAKVLPATKRNKQMHLILEALYKERTGFKEADFSRLYAAIHHQIRQRSLLLLFTNFETLSGMQRQLPYMLRMSRSHLLVVIFFRNTEMNDLLRSRPVTVQQIYDKAIAEKLTYEKQLIVKELRRHGIHTILTAPEDLTVNTINKYLELKARGLI